MKKLRILVACEESQAVCTELRKLGHEAYSCDIKETSGSHPEWHITGCALKEAYSGRYDMMIAFPPCTYLAVSGARWMYNPDKSINQDRATKQRNALDFVQKLMDAPIKQIAIENPVSVISSKIKKPTQIIQPWMFGHGETKKTCLWLQGLPKLTATDIVAGREQRIWKLGPSKDRATLRSKTYKGIAEAMAEQWTNNKEIQP